MLKLVANGKVKLTSDSLTEIAHFIVEHDLTEHDDLELWKQQAEWGMINTPFSLRVPK